jgi:hypothetical protein
MFKAVNAKVGAHEQFKPEQQDVLTKVAYGQIARELQNIQSAILLPSDKAETNELFMSLD